MTNEPSGDAKYLFTRACVLVGRAGCQSTCQSSTDELTDARRKIEEYLGATPFGKPRFTRQLGADAIAAEIKQEVGRVLSYFPADAERTRRVALSIASDYLHGALIMRKALPAPARDLTGRNPFDLGDR